MTRHSNNDYELIIGSFGIIIAAVSAFISYKLGTDLLETFKSFIMTIFIVFLVGWFGRYNDMSLSKIVSLSCIAIWFTWHDTLRSVNDKIISDYNNTIQWGEPIPPELIWYGESWFIWLIQILLVLVSVGIFYKQRFQY
jgi:hypothetical protein